MTASNQPATTDAASLNGTQRSRSLVLIVEDDRDNAHLIARVLSGARCDVLVTSLGQDALNHARTTLPDIITLDLRLPDLTGYDLIQQLKASELTTAIPIIVISILADERDPRLANAYATLTKPIDPALLRRTVAAALCDSSPLSS